MRASQHRIALAGAGMFFLLINTLGCLSQSIPQSPSPFSASQTDDRISAGVKLGDYSLTGVAKGDLYRQLVLLSPKFYQPPDNAHKQAETLKIVAEHPGKELDIEQTQQRILRAKNGETVEPALKTIQPLITTHDLEMAVPLNAKQIGHFTTPILDTKPDRVENIKVTAQLLNNTVIEPGQEFSFNRIVGIPTQAKGFKLGTVFGDGGELKQELGGGMCQISSTLYNVALDHGMEIMERHAHSRPVPYVAPGRDATIYDDKDLRFRNTTAQPILIKSWVSGGTAHVAFYQPTRFR
jgi:vancomycin resistance protein YoaR